METCVSRLFAARSLDEKVLHLLARNIGDTHDVVVAVSDTRDGSVAKSATGILRVYDLLGDRLRDGRSRRIAAFTGGGSRSHDKNEDKQILAHL